MPWLNLLLQTCHHQSYVVCSMYRLRDELDRKDIRHIPIAVEGSLFVLTSIINPLLADWTLLKYDIGTIMLDNGILKIDLRSQL